MRCRSLLLSLIFATRLNTQNNGKTNGAAVHSAVILTTSIMKLTTYRMGSCLSSKTLLSPQNSRMLNMCPG